MTEQKLRIAIDKDDTLNWLTHEIMVRTGVANPKPEDIPVFSEIKDAVVIVMKAMENNEEVTEDLLVDFPRVTVAFLQTRMECLADPDFFAAKPYGLAHSIVDMATENGFEPTICTKTLSNHKKFAEVTAAKMRFWKEHFSDIDMMIATGTKCIDAIALIDDLDKNCLVFNQTNHRPTLVWNHKTGTKQLLQDFYDHCTKYGEYLASNVQTAIHKNIIVEKSGNKVQLVTVSDENLESEKDILISGGSLVESIDIENGTYSVINLYIKETELTDSFVDIEELRNQNNTLNSIIFNNFNI